MNKEIKVYLQYPWRFSDSPYYKYLIENPPEKIKYLNTIREKGATHKKNKLKILYFIKTQIRKWTRFFNLVIPNAHKTKKGDYDLIHCAHCLSKNKDKPWIADLEGCFSMFLSGYNRENGIKKVENLILSQNCKRILPWTEDVKKEILKIIPSVEKKLEVVYPAIPKRKKLTKKPLDKVNLLFFGRYFYQKGGLHAIESIDRLTNKYKNVYGIFISEIPKEIFEKYSKNKKIEFYDLIPQEKLFKLMDESHIFLYPGYSDSFGFGFLEAMSFGLPIVTVDSDSRKEIVKDGKTGLIVEKPLGFDWSLLKIFDERLISQIVKKTSILIEDKILLKKMSKNCLREIEKGKFSIEKRNKKLTKIYEEALK